MACSTLEKNRRVAAPSPRPATTLSSLQPARASSLRGRLERAAGRQQLASMRPSGRRAKLPRARREDPRTGKVVVGQFVPPTSQLRRMLLPNPNEQATGSPEESGQLPMQRFRSGRKPNHGLGSDPAESRGGGAYRLPPRQSRLSASRLWVERTRGRSAPEIFVAHRPRIGNAR